MEFDAATQSLKCPHCGEEQKIDANRSAVREHKLTAEARQMVRVQDKKSTTMQCPGRKADRCNRAGWGGSVPDR